MSIYRILLLADNLVAGGAERQMTELIKGINKKCFYPIVATFEKNGHYSNIINEMGIPLYHFTRRWRWDLTPAKNLIQLIRNKRISLVHSWGLTSSFYGTLAAKVCRIKLINGSIRGSTKNNSFDYQFIIRKILLHIADIVVSNTRSGLHNFDLKESKNKLVFYNGFDLIRCKVNDTREQIKNELGIHHFEKVISMIAGIKSTKDFFSYIKTAKQITDTYDRVCFLIVGDGESEYKRKLENLISELELKDRVLFLGFRNDVERILKVTDIFVHCDFKFTREGIPNSILEAMAMKVPVVASNNGGVSELMIDSKTGFLIQPESVKSLTEKILYLIKNPLIAKKYGELGRVIVETKFSLQKMIEFYQNLYLKA